MKTLADFETAIRQCNSYERLYKAARMAHSLYECDKLEQDVRTWMSKSSEKQHEILAAISILLEEQK